jgi:hypothetical protein
VLPVFAIGSFFAVIFCLTVALSLSTLRVPGSIADFERSYGVVRNMTIGPAPLEAARLSLLEYDGASNFRFFVNGYRVFGSSANCVMNYQCKKASDQQAEDNFRQLQALKLEGGSIYHIYRLYSLPHVEDISGFLVEGRNNIDIHVDNSGLGDCALKATVELSFSDQPVTTRTISISPDTGATSIAEGPLQVEEVFYSGGLPLAKNAALEMIPWQFRLERAMSNHKEYTRQELYGLVGRPQW